jgi:L-threonylcarbamoyladenylate synthase
VPATSLQTTLTRSPEAAARVLREGGRVVFPTETVYGLGADAFDAGGVRGVFEAKGRPADNPLIVHVAGAGRVERVARAVPPGAERLAERFWPGPLTLVLPRRRELPEVVTAGLDTVGVRVPRLPLARRFLEACETPAAAPSANLSGRPSPTTWQAARDDLEGRVECILQGAPTEAGLESTVVDATEPGALRVLRAGATTLEALRAATGPGVTVVSPSEDPPAEASDSDAPAAPRSPGTRHRHYAPEARVVVVDGPPGASETGAAAYIGLRPPADPGAFARVRACENVEAYARALFAFFRAADAAGARVIYAQRVPAKGLGRALMDRLRRASAASNDAPRS